MNMGKTEAPIGPYFKSKRSTHTSLSTGCPKQLQRWSSARIPAYSNPRPKNRGGLGLKHMKEVNHVLLAQSAWRLLLNWDKLWSQVLSGKYRDIRELNLDKTTRTTSYTCRSLVVGNKLMRLGVRQPTDRAELLMFDQSTSTALAIFLEISSSG
ncbi:hypothetical protein M9H77_14167 [Catharanthus roseus]|uniref:Uncharacterized protein n=1 Tax=Catharanthus roseus TaxID=4058 RepID=A0ACC0BMF2_CATRO|nr:hypothetical protein M9H77_14167 [Catharanthus roseus]